MAQKRELWSEKECLALLSAYGTEEIKKKLEGTHKNANIYRKISDIMGKKGIHRDWMQCITKFKHMKLEYKKFKDTLSCSGAGRGKEPKFFQIMVMLHAHLLVLKFQKLQALMDSVSYLGRPLEK